MSYPSIKKEGLTFEQAAERFAVGIANLTRWTKTIAPKATRENRPRKVDLKALAKASRSKHESPKRKRFWAGCCVSRVKQVPAITLVAQV